VRRPRLVLFLALCLAQLAIPLSMAYRYERTLREGALYRFRTEPFDPVDAFRGRYVAIRLRLLTPEELDEAWGTRVYATLTSDAQGFATVLSISMERPASGHWIEGKVAEPVYEPLPEGSTEPPRTAPRLLGTRIDLPIDRYYMEESKAPAADRIWMEGMQQAEASARVRVRKGVAAIEGLDINGVPIERWIATLPPQQ
jgi:uncharacterized membrane-anchored protein